MAWIIFSLALIGLLNALYFAMSYYGLARGRLIPVVGQGSSCRAVMQTPDARALGLPNFIFGALYYAGLIVLSWTPHPASAWMAAAQIVSYLAVLLGVYLVHALRYRLHVSCPLCLLGHGVNLALAVCLTVVSM